MLKKSKLRHVGVTRAQSKHRQEVERRGDMLDEQDGAVSVMDDPTSDTPPVHTESDIDDLGSSADDEEDTLSSPAVPAGEDVGIPLPELDIH